MVGSAINCESNGEYSGVPVVPLQINAKTTMAVTLTHRQRQKKSETKEEEWEQGMEDARKKQSIMGAGPARIYMEHVIECWKTFTSVYGSFS